MNEHPHEHDPLDDLLQQAQWDAPSEASIQRLAMHYRIQSRRDSWRRIVRSASAAAAVFAIVAGVGVWSFFSRTTPQPNVADARPLHTPPFVPPKPQAIAADPFAGRPPTPVEQAWMAMAERKRRNPPGPQVDAVAERLKPAIAILAQTSDASPQVVLCDALGDRAANLIEDRLLAMVLSLKTAERIAATRLLHEVASPRSLRTYLRLFEADETAEAALPGVLRWVSTSDLTKLIRAESRPVLQEELLAGLMERGTPQAVAAYLELSEDRATHTAACQALGKVKNPPFAVLESYWSQGQVDKRYAAARLLGRMADGPVLQRLALQLGDPATQQAALVALMSSERGQALLLLEAASCQNPALTSLRVTLEPEALTTRTPVAQKTVYYSMAPDPT